MVRQHVGFFALAACCACSPTAEDVGSSSAAYTTQCPTTTVEGVDISAGQAPVTWSSVTGANRQFAFIKATQGTYYTSSSFASQYAGAKTAGVYRSAYHFFDPTEDGIAQANYFLGVVGTVLPDDLPPMLDMECPDGSATCLGFTGGSGNAPSATIVSRALDWLSTVEAATGKKPIVYTFPAYFPGLATPDTGLAAYPLFIATLASCASVPAPWTTAAFWQYSWTGTVAGIPGQVDMDLFFGTLSDLQTFAFTCKAAGATCATSADCCGPSVCTPGGTCSANPLPAQTTGNPWITTVSWPSNGQSELFVRGKDGTLLHSEGTAGTWSAPASLGQPVACGSAASYWLKSSSARSGFHEVFSPGPNGATGLDDSYDDTKQAWRAPTSFDGAGLTEYTSLSWPDGHVEVFALGQGGVVSHRYWDFTASAWTAWSSMGGAFVSTPTAIIRGDSTGELFAIDAAGQPWHAESSASGWSAFRSLLPLSDAGVTSQVALASRPVPVRWPDGHMQVFAASTSGDLVTSTQTTSWGAFTTIASGVHGEPAAVIGSGQPDVFVRDSNNVVNHTWPLAAGWQPLTAVSTPMTASVDPWAWQSLDGSVEVFAALDDGHGDATLSHVRRDPAGTWGTWQALGGPIDVCDGQGPVGSDAGTPPPGSSSGGCACDVTTTNGSPRAAFLTLVMFGGAVVRRRRRP